MADAPGGAGPPRVVRGAVASNASSTCSTARAGRRAWRELDSAGEIVARPHRDRSDVRNRASSVEARSGGGGSGPADDDDDDRSPSPPPRTASHHAAETGRSASHGASGAVASAAERAAASSAARSIGPAQKKDPTARLSARLPPITAETHANARTRAASRPSDARSDAPTIPANVPPSVSAQSLSPREDGRNFETRARRAASTARARAPADRPAPPRWVRPTLDVGRGPGPPASLASPRRPCPGHPPCRIGPRAPHPRQVRPRKLHFPTDVRHARKMLAAVGSGAPGRLKLRACGVVRRPRCRRRRRDTSGRLHRRAAGIDPARHHCKKRPNTHAHADGPAGPGRGDPKREGEVAGAPPRSGRWPLLWRRRRDQSRAASTLEAQHRAKRLHTSAASRDQRPKPTRRRAVRLADVSGSPAFQPVAGGHLDAACTPGPYERITTPPRPPPPAFLPPPARRTKKPDPKFQGRTRRSANHLSRHPRRALKATRMYSGKETLIRRPQAPSWLAPPPTFRTPRPPSTGIRPPHAAWGDGEGLEARDRAPALETGGFARSAAWLSCLGWHACVKSNALACLCIAPSRRASTFDPEPGPSCPRTNARSGGARARARLAASEAKPPQGTFRPRRAADCSADTQPAHRAHLKHQKERERRSGGVSARGGRCGVSVHRRTSTTAAARARLRGASHGLFRPSNRLGALYRACWGTLRFESRAPERRPSRTRPSRSTSAAT